MHKLSGKNLKALQTLQPSSAFARDMIDRFLSAYAERQGRRYYPGRR
jgi:hypothetical protein